MKPRASRRSVPFVLSILGVVIFSLLIGAIRSFIVIPNLSIIYLLPVLFAAVS
jgi:hypothetical protein